MAKWQTILEAEDGTYTNTFDSYEEALEYVEYQMGSLEKSPFGGYSDSYGRRMFIEETK